MDWNRRQGRIAAAIVLVAACALLLGRLSSFGIWDPWELAAADLARQATTDGVSGLERPPLTTWLIAQGFALFGIHEWSGRLPMAFTGLLTVALAYLLVARFAGRRAGVWSALIAATTPLFLFNARQMLGVAPAFAASAAVFLCASAAVFQPASLRTSSSRQRLLTIAWLAGLAISAALATLASGALLGVAPPLLGVGVAIVARNELTRPSPDRRRALSAGVVLALGLAITAGAAHAVWADYAGFGWWTGGTPRGGAPPTWEMALERTFHSFAPWSALLPIALGRMLVGQPDPAGPRAQPRSPVISLQGRALTLRHPEENALRLALIGWVAFGLLAETIFTARYGPATFLPLVGLAAIVGLTLRDVERSEQPWWGSAVLALLFVGLLVRDFAKYPSGPIEGLVAEGLEVPEVFNPARPWALTLGGFALLIALGLVADPRPGAYPGLRAEARELLARWRAGGVTRGTLAHAWLRIGIPAELIAEQWKRGLGHKLWMGVFALLITAIAGFGLACLVAPNALMNLGLTSLGLRIGSSLLALPPAIVLGIGLVRLALFGFGKLGPYRLFPAILAALAVGGYASFGFQPALSAHFSPREVYDTYNELAAEGEPLGEFRVGGRAATYYARGEVQELASQAELIRFLQQDRRVWAAFRADDLASVNREYRRHASRHLFVADARSARMILATNQPVDGLTNHNYLAEAVLTEAPTPEHPSNINFDNRIELLGIDLDLPHDGYVGPGEEFGITWYFRVNAPVPGGYQLFVHIDGAGQRINGDHEPVDGRYPVRLWEPGDIVVDRQRLRVPANYRRGNLTIFVGFYSGQQRLEVVEGPADDVDRGRAGILPIR